MWDDAKALNALAGTLAAMAAIAVVAVLALWIARLPAFAFREVVVVTPLRRVSAPHLEAVIREELRGTFFTLNLDAARAAIGRVPWVRAVAVRRQWPRRLELAVEEHEPLARWGDAALVDSAGEVFVASFAGSLPRFDGPEGRAAELTARYRDWSARLAPLSLEVSALAMSARGGWSMRAVRAGAPPGGASDAITQDEGSQSRPGERAPDALAFTIVLGRDEVDERLARFVASYPRTIGALARGGVGADAVDLRYRNGFAARMPAFREKPAKRTG